MADNSGKMAISQSGVIVLCIVMAGVVVLLGWAIGHRVWQNRDDDRERGLYATDNGQSQFAYMRDIRERYKEDLAARFGHGGRGERKPALSRQQSVPLSMVSGPSHY